ncbi:MAG TPA: hypothetical protein VK458_21605 [Myxococcaceae bacterium]|nr:hypothetical protein [Myxococcaceae bacterium]
MIRKSLLCASLMLVGCGRMDREEEFRSVLPTQDMVEVKTPASTGQALELESRSTQGGRSDMYTLTRVATVVVNGGTLAVLGLVDGVTKHRPTTVSENTAVWGPHSEPLAANTWKLTVKKLGNDTYSYTVSGKPKTADDSAFVDVITGTHTAALNEADEPMRGFGQGEFTIDWDKAQTLPERDNNIGKLTVKYARVDDKSAVTVDAAFRQVRDDKDATRRVDMDYRYAATPGQGGQFDFRKTEDFHKVSGSARQENLTIKSRWLQTGAGRSDVKMVGGDLPAGFEAKASECWDTTFASRFLTTNYASSAFHYGTEATDCAFTTASYSSL